MTTKTKGATGGDFLVSLQSKEFCLRSCYVSAQAGQSGDADLSVLAGYPVIITNTDSEQPLEASLALAGDESSVNGFIIHGPEIADLSPGSSTGRKDLYSVLVEGPAVVNSDKLPATDVDGNSFVAATLKTRLAALNIAYRTQPSKSSTQTT